MLFIPTDIYIENFPETKRLFFMLNKDDITFAQMV